MSVGRIDTEVVKAAMDGRKWNVQQLAEKTGLEPNNLRRIFKTKATAEKSVWALSEALNLELPELLGFADGQLTTGQSLLLARLEAHMTVKELAAESGVQPGNIWNYENDAMPRLDTARQIAAALDQSIERVFFRYIGILE